LGRDDCERPSTLLDDYPAPVRVQAVAQTLRSCLNQAAEDAVDSGDYIQTAAG
jgi:hypothetical protein